METVIDIPAEHEANVFGQFDAYAKKIERALHVTLIARGESVKIMGDALKVEKAKKVLDQLVELSKRGNTIQEQNVDYTLALVMEDSEENVLEILSAIPYRENRSSRRHSVRKNTSMQSVNR